MAKCLICGEKLNDVVEHFFRKHDGRCGICRKVIIKNFYKTRYGASWDGDDHYHNKICSFCGGEVISRKGKDEGYTIECKSCGYLYDED